MSNVLKSIRLDNYILKAYYKAFIVVYWLPFMDNLRLASTLAYITVVKPLI